ncbi:transposase family protein [Thiorhodococcus mannitoliphagus]|uniref:Transposase family protein n=1 Tax=Thiorhodococcus mannitoliphagus TaxID=329406 RepID=A0A6P1E8Z1_9GAMM|nr:transposase family protein [Thiorhodococcus mannitoliphagus]NEX23905.1 transposase family protein [Thiorhodococcus mannitoliphagus]
MGEEISLRHLPMFGHQVFIVLRPERYGCPRCEDRPTTTQTLDWYTPRSRLTKAFEQEVLLTLINSTVEDVSRKQALGTDGAHSQFSVSCRGGYEGCICHSFQ